MRLSGIQADVNGIVEVAYGSTSAYAGGSSWSEVIEGLQDAGLAAAAVQNPLTSLADDVAHTRRILALHDGPARVSSSTRRCC
jgi:hypothetical protein